MFNKKLNMIDEKKIDLAIENIKEKFPFDGYLDHATECYKSIVNSVSENLILGSKILDLGCGPADKPAILQELGFNCTGYDDMSDEWHDIDNNKEKILNFAKESGVKYIVAGEQNLELEKESFDMLMSNDMLEHLHDSPRIILNDFLEYVKPGGFLFITVPNAVNIRKRLAVLRGRTNLPDYYSYFWSPGKWRGHVREYVKNDLILLCKYLGLELISVKGSDHMVSVKLKNILRKIYLFLTNFDDSLKDSWTLIAKKPSTWKNNKELNFDEYIKYLSSKSISGYDPNINK